MARRLVQAWLRHRMLFLFVALLATIGIEPVLEAADIRVRALESVLALSILAALAGSWGHRPSRVVSAGVGLALAVWLALHVLHFGRSASLAPAVLSGAGLLTAGTILASVFGARRVDAEHVAGALNAYLLIGIAFGGFYATLESLTPGTLRGATLGASPELDDAVYFSFVTMATLGYGDLVPATRAARALAVLEAVFGQLYLAVLVARLVSLYARDADDRRP
jgi:hypothetical protein